MSGYDQFKKLTEEFRSTTTFAALGSAGLPFLAGMAGIAPPWPENAEAPTALFILASLIICFQVFRKQPRKVVTRYVILFAALFCVLAVSYFLLLARFTYTIPTDGTRVVLGCGWTEQARILASQILDLGTGECPGPFQEVMIQRSYDPSYVWGNESVAMMRNVILFAWITMFFSFSAMVATFLTFQMESK